jgi:hypothetical protein
VPLPIIQLQIPIVWFYRAAPLILFALYLYLHAHLGTLWRALSGHQSLDATSYSWALPGTRRAYFKVHQKSDDAPAGLSSALSIILSWWLAPMTLLLIWGRYLPVHDWWGTSFLILLIAGVGTLGLHSYFAMRRALDKKFVSRFRLFGYLAFTFVSIALLLGGLSHGAIDGAKHCSANKDATEDRVEFCWSNALTWVPFAFSKIGYNTFADFDHAIVSAKPERWWTAEDITDAVVPVDLTKADLRNLGASSAFLVNVDFRGANLQDADLSKANLTGADLNCAEIKGDLLGHPLTCPNLADALSKRLITCTQLQRANFSRAKLRDADLTYAVLDGAHFFSRRPRGLRPELRGPPKCQSTESRFEES